VICTTLGATLTEQFLSLKRAEIAEFQHHVSDWELRRYAQAF
jgi:glutamine synthetase